jgi:hypothetical protein
MNDAGTDGFSVGWDRGMLARLDELDLISLRVFGLKPATPIVPGMKFTQAIYPAGTQVLE